MNKVVKIFFVVAVFLITRLVYTQPVTWMRYYDYNNWSNYGRQVIQTFDGGYAFYSVTSVSDNSFKKNILLTKTDLYGIIEFNTLITDSSTRGLIPTSFQQTNDSGFIMSGFTTQTGFLIKTDRYGNQQWRRDYTRPEASVRFQSMKITHDNGYICGEIFFLQI